MMPPWRRECCARRSARLLSADVIVSYVFILITSLSISGKPPMLHSAYRSSSAAVFRLACIQPRNPSVCSRVMSSLFFPPLVVMAISCVRGVVWQLSDGLFPVTYAFGILGHGGQGNREKTHFQWHFLPRLPPEDALRKQWTAERIPTVVNANSRGR